MRQPRPGGQLQELRAAGSLYRAAGKGARKRLASVIARFDPQEDYADRKLADARPHATAPDRGS